MFKLKLEKWITLLTILSAISFVALSPATNTWASERSRSQVNDSENQIRFETNGNNEVSRTLNDDKGSSITNNKSRTNIEVTKNLLTMGKTHLSIMVKSVKVEGHPEFTVIIDQYDPLQAGQNPKTIEFTFNPADRNLAIKPFDVELDPGTYYKVKLNTHDPEYYVDLSSLCYGLIDLGDHNTCEISIKKTPNILVYTHAAANGIKASDFVLGEMINNKVIDEFPANEEGIKLLIGINDEYKIYVKDPKGYFVQYIDTSNIEDPEYYDKWWCRGTIVDDGNPSLTKAKCYITIDISKLKVIVKVDGGDTPVENFHYKINTNDVTKTSVDGHVYSGKAQGTEIPMQPGAFYHVQPLPPFNNYSIDKSGECDSMGELGKIKLCTVTMTYYGELDSCHTEINEQGKPVKVC